MKLKIKLTSFHVLPDWDGENLEVAGFRIEMRVREVIVNQAAQRCELGNANASSFLR